MFNFKQNNAAFLVILAAVLWGTTGTAQALAPQGATPLTIGAVRLTFGGIAILFFSLVKGSFKNLKKWPIPTTLLAALSIALYQPFFFAGVSQTGVAVGTIVAISSSPVFAGILGFFVRGEKPTGKWFIATSMAILGNMLLVFSGNGVMVNFTGILYSLGAGFAYALYSTASKKLLEKYPAELVAAVVITLGGILISPVLIASDLHWLASYRGVAVSVHLGIFTIAIAYSLYNQGLKKTFLANAVSLTLAEPLVASMLGIFLLKEKINLMSGLGIILLFFGIMILSINLNRTKKKINENSFLG